jgi:esterase/lipase
MYAFHIVQAAGVLTTTIAAGYDIKELVWVGASMNVIATLIQVFEKTNESVSKTLMQNINDIRNGMYVDEGMIAPDDEKRTPLLNKTENDASNNV